MECWNNMLVQQVQQVGQTCWYNKLGKNVILTCCNVRRTYWSWMLYNILVQLDQMVQKLDFVNIGTNIVNHRCCTTFQSDYGCCTNMLFQHSIINSHPYSLAEISAEWWSNLLYQQVGPTFRSESAP